jgi:iron complex outermembrane receptor protein
VAYTGIYGTQATLGPPQSKYVFNYPSSSAVVSWRAGFHQLLFRTRVGALNRRARDPYALWDFAAAWNARRVRPFLQLSNISSTQYQEVQGVAMPGRSIVGGVELVLFSRR